MHTRRCAGEQEGFHREPHYPASGDQCLKDRAFWVQGNANTASKGTVGVGAIKHCVQGVVKPSLGRELGPEHRSLTVLAEFTC